MSVVAKVFIKRISDDVDEKLQRGKMVLGKERAR